MVYFRIALRSVLVRFSIGSRSVLDWFSIGSRSVLDRFSIDSRSSFVHPPFILRSAIEDRSKIDRRMNGESSEVRRRCIETLMGNQGKGDPNKNFIICSYAARGGTLIVINSWTLIRGHNFISYGLAMCGAHFPCEASLLFPRGNLRPNIQLGHACPMKTAIRLGP